MSVSASATLAINEKWHIHNNFAVPTGFFTPIAGHSDSAQAV